MLAVADVSYLFPQGGRDSVVPSRYEGAELWLFCRGYDCLTNQTAAREPKATLTGLIDRRLGTAQRAGEVDAPEPPRPQRAS